MTQSLLGHNKGPSLASGPSWQRYCWQAARKALLPVLPVEVVRLRVARAKELGLDYQTYAGIRAQTDRDLVAFLFSTEALGLRPRTAELPVQHLPRLQALAAGKIILTAPDLSPETALERLKAQGIAFDAASAAPPAFAGWGEARRALRRALDQMKLPSDAVLFIGEGSLQKDWAEAAKLAGFLPSDRFFPTMAL